MTVSMHGMALSLGIFLLLGVLYGVLYDAFRVLHMLCGLLPAPSLPRRLMAWRPPLLRQHFHPQPRRDMLKKTKAVLLFVFDFLYAILAGILFIICTYWQNDGIFRFFYLLGVVGGFFCYHCTVGRLVMSLVAFWVYGIRLLWTYALFLVSTPIRFLLRLCWRLGGSFCYAIYLPLYAHHRRRFCLLTAKTAFLPPFEQII